MVWPLRAVSVMEPLPRQPSSQSPWLEAHSFVVALLPVPWLHLVFVRSLAPCVPQVFAEEAQ